MEIVYFGNSCFRIKTKEVTIVTDPYHTTSYLAAKLPKLEADIVSISHDHEDHNNAEGVTGSAKRPIPFVITGPGEYEVSGVSVFGLGTAHDKEKGKSRGKNTVYLYIADGMRLVHLGDLGHKPDDKVLEQISECDILFAPVGDKVTLEVSDVVEVVGQIQPKIVIPMHYLLPDGNQELQPVNDFMKEMGLPEFETADKLNITQDKLPEEREVIVLAKR